MTSDRPASRTAIMVAALRAQHSARAEPLFSDPWAAALSADEGPELVAMHEAIFPAAELWIAVRTAFIDAQLSRYVAPEGDVWQVVLLGAGLDTRAARLAAPRVRFFEVDHPASQQEKRRRLAGLADYPVDAATYVACDFERQDFIEQLVAAGMSLDAPALVIWEGVTLYLSDAAVRGTLDRIATACHPRTVLIFDHIQRKLAEGDRVARADEEMRAMVDKLGEPFRFGINDVTPLAAAAGFRHVRTVSFDEACLSFTNTYDRDRRFRFQSLAVLSRGRRLCP